MNTIAEALAARCVRWVHLHFTAGYADCLKTLRKGTHLRTTQKNYRSTCETNYAPLTRAYNMCIACNIVEYAEGDHTAVHPSSPLCGLAMIRLLAYRKANKLS